ncbi:chlorophyll synthesis pathway protein BchC [Ideonella sp. 3Y2]|uniref:Chlorophyll synthesis pathway protein BchC n=1 Tax=Ideonella alba TaxID=2824118 RepID=A0A940Y7X9_9BURK|nr:chlorophyll synthesis pathway protein BchC [Ideonella alba]
MSISTDTLAVVLASPEHLQLERLALSPRGEDDLLVEVEWSGISTGTERLLWSGRMPPFPGMGYPLVPGYESVGRVAEAGADSAFRPGDRVFVPGANCFGPVRGLFGGAAQRLVVPARRVVAVDEALGEDAVLMALAATAYHAVARGGTCEHPEPPELIVGHGVLGRLLARLNVAAGCTNTVVWETDARRQDGARGYTVLHPDDDPRRDYRSVCDVSGDAAMLDVLMQRLAPGGEIVLAGFYPDRVSFAFPPAFMREARIRVAAEWQRPDLLAVKALIESGVLPLDGLVTHHCEADQADQAYRTAFGDAGCLKMILDWRHSA